MKHQPAFSSAKPLSNRVCWLLGALAAFLGGGALAYYWRVFYSLDTRGWPGGLLLGGCALAGALLVGLAWCICHGLKTLPGRVTACILLAGTLFCFANPPMQAPDEYNHYLRSWSISQGHFDFDAERVYPEDVCLLYNAFPGAWVSAHTSQGLTQDANGNPVAYNTAGYSLKQYGETGRVESVADSFAEYFAGGEAKPVTEPILFMVLPFLPQALGMLLTRLFGGGALACLYGGRLVNLCVYAFLCYQALKKCEKGQGVLAAVMLLPLSLYMAASLSYDAALLGCYYLCAAFLGKDSMKTADLFWFGGAFLWMNLAKPYVNLLWVLLLFFLPKKSWQPRLGGKTLPRWTAAAVLLVCAAALTLFTEWYGAAFRYHYGTIGRMLGEDVQQLPQLLFVLKNPLRYIAVLMGTLYENSFFLGQLGVFGALDLPVGLLNLTGVPVLMLAAALCSREDTLIPRRRSLWGGAFGVVYAVGAATAMYITYTPVGMVRIIGLQARYFLPVFLFLFWLLSRGFGRLLRPAAAADRAQHTLCTVCGVYAVCAAVLLAQHYFIGPVYLIQ